MRRLAALQAEAGNVEDAVGLLQRAIETSPSQATLHEDLAYAFERSGDTAAEAAYRQALALKPRADTSRGRLAKLLNAAGSPDDAIQLVREGVAENPQSAALQRALGSLLERNGRTQEAVDAYREYSRLAPNAADAAQLTARADTLEKRDPRQRNVTSWPALR